jgi:hypothetical protein
VPFGLAASDFVGAEFLLDQDFIAILRLHPLQAAALAIGAGVRARMQLALRPGLGLDEAQLRYHTQICANPL